MIEVVLTEPHNRNSQYLIDSSDTGDPTGTLCCGREKSENFVFTG